MANFTRKEMRRRRRWRIRKKISGTRSEPRMAVCASGKHLYVQFIDDENGHTLASASTLDSQLRKDNLSANVHGAEIIGRTAAERALAAGLALHDLLPGRGCRVPRHYIRFPVNRLRLDCHQRHPCTVPVRMTYRTRLVAGRTAPP